MVRRKSSFGVGVVGLAVVLFAGVCAEHAFAQAKDKGRAKAQEVFSVPLKISLQRSQQPLPDVYSPMGNAANILRVLVEGGKTQLTTKFEDGRAGGVISYRAVTPSGIEKRVLSKTAL